MAKRETLFMETTRIGAEATAAEINTLLGKAGATRVMTEYNGGEIAAIYFQLPVHDADVPFRLPIRTEPVLRILLSRRRRVLKRGAIEAQARRVAWRQALRWLQAQLAFARTGMVDLAEVFLPYVLTGPAETFYEKLRSSGKLLALAPPKAKEPPDA